MTSIKFTSSLDTKQFEESIKNSKRTVTEWVKDVQQSAAGIDKSFQKAGDSIREFSSLSKSEMKESIAIQKQAIKDLEQELKRLQETQSKATGKNLSNTNLAVGKKTNELTSEKAALAAMQKEQVLANEAETASQGGIISSLGKWAIGLLTVQAAMKVGKAMIASTETTAHSFEKVISSAASGVGYFFKSLMSGDFNNFNEGLSTAIKGAKDYVDAMEDVHRLGNQAKVKGADIDLEIAKLRELTWDKSKENTATRVNALNRIVKLTDEKNQLQVPIAEKNFNAALNKASTDTGGKLSTQELMTLIGKYDNLKEVKELGDRVNQLSASLAGGKNTGTYKGMTLAAANAQKELDALGEEGRIAGQLASRFGTVTFEAMDNVANSYKAMREAQTTKEVGSKFDQRQKASAINALKDEQDALSKKQIEYDIETGKQRLKNKLDIEQELLNSQKDSAEKSRAQADLDYRKTISDLAEQRTEALKKYNESPAVGGIDSKSEKKTKKYRDNLPEVDQKQFDEKAIAAAKVKEAKIVEINKEEAEKIKEIQREVEDYRLTGIEKEKAAVAKKYDEMDRIAKKAGDSKSQEAIIGLRAKANKEIDDKYALQQIDIQEQLEARKNEITAQGVNRDQELQKLNFETWKKYQQQRVNILSTSSKVEDWQQAALLQSGIEIAENNKKLEKEAKLRQAILETSQQLTSVLVKNGQLSDQQAESLNGALSMLGKAASGDWIGAGMAFVGNFVKALGDATGGNSAEKEAAAAQEAYDNLSKSMTALASALDHQQKALDRSFGTDRIIAFDNAILLSSSNLKQVTQDLNGYIDAYNKSIPSSSTNRPSGDHRKPIGNVADITPTMSWVSVGTNAGTGRGGNAVQVFTEATKQQIKEAEAAIAGLYAQLNSGNLTDTQSKELQLLLDNYEKYYDDLLQREKARQDFLTGTTEDSITSSIIDGFKNGYTSAAQFATTFEDLMKSAMLNSLSLSMQPQVKAWYEQFAKDMESGGGLSQDEKDKLKKQWDDIIAKGKDNLDQINSIAGLSPANIGTAQASTLTGSIQRTLSESTGGELAGLLRKSSDDGRKVRDYTKMAVDHLVGIEKNTLDTVTELKNCVALLAESNVNTAKTAKNTGPVNLRGF